ncbi:hypothetical protein ACQR1I_03560 [Bradyrhizobium sp. HKCCYLS2038]|uniref:hypothetical protein n=1 Tax=unclassified Bradyrhizobium TaxID=2631580 RepID=UPI003EBB822C
MAAQVAAQARVDPADSAPAVTIEAATTRAENAFLPLVCHLLPAINHPRYSRVLSGLHMLGSGKRVPQIAQNAKQIPSMIAYDERFAKRWHAAGLGFAHQGL